MNRQIIISVLCGDSNNGDFIGCHGHLNRKCKHDNHCDLNNLSNKQIEYILSSNKTDVYLNACPGSGKTEVAGIKCAYEMNLWCQRFSGIAILSFTNSAENELRERVSSYYRTQPDFPHFLGTFTSWLHGYIANPFLYLLTGHKNCEKSDANIQIIDSDCDSDFLKAFKTKYSYGKTLRNIVANTYSFDYKTKTFQYSGNNRIEQSEFLKQLKSINYMKKDLIQTKKKFWNAGFFLYEDVEGLTYRLLLQRPDIANLVSKRFPFIIVDECQDLSYIQLLILGELHKHGTKLHFIGDLDQSIYSFRGIDPIDIKEFIKKYGFSEVVLEENYRSNQRIVQASGILINRSKAIIGMVPQVIKSPLVVLLYKKNHEFKMIQKYLELLSENGIEKRNCRIIVRNNSLRAKLYGNKQLNNEQTQNTVEDYAYAIYLNNSNSVADYQESIQIISRAIQKTFFANSVHENKTKLYRPQELDESTWRRVLLKIHEGLLQNPEVMNLNQPWEKWKKSLKSYLSNAKIQIPCNTMNTLRLRKGVKDKTVYDSFMNKNNNICESRIKVETIHSCKGMSLDSVLFVSAYQRGGENSGSYWKEWFPIYSNNDISEGNRLAYVASSRAKHLLVFGIPSLVSSQVSDEDISFFISCGFQVIDCG